MLHNGTPYLWVGVNVFLPYLCVRHDCKMKVLLDIKDNKADFVMELLANFSFVKAKQIEDEKAQLVDEIKEAVKEMKLIRAGKKKARNAEDFLNEL